MITYDDKVQNAVNPLPDEEQWRAVDANEVKTEVNANITDTAAALAASAAAQATANAAAVKANNLSDLTNATTARTNLGLGTLATQSGTFSGTHSGTSSGTNTGDQSLSGLQPLDQDITDIAALTPSNDDIIQRKSGAWANRTISQLKTDLSLSGSNTGDQDLSGLAVKANNLSDLTNAATARTNLSLGNVTNTSDANKPVSTAQQTALDLKENKNSNNIQFALVNTFRSLYRY